MRKREIKISDTHTRIVYEGEDSSTYSGAKIKVMEYNGSDGSKLDKPMSKAYISNIRSRTTCDSETSRTIYPGDYGTGKKGLV